MRAPILERARALILAARRRSVCALMRVRDENIARAVFSSFHKLTTQSPREVWLAIDVKARKPTTDWPPLHVVRFSGEALKFGVERHVIEGAEVAVTSRAKTVADCFKYRNKIGNDVAVDALREYLRKRGRSMDDLLAQQRRVALPGS